MRRPINQRRWLTGRIECPKRDENGRRVPLAHRRAWNKTVKDIARAARANRTKLNVVSGFRTRAKQEALHALYLAGKGNPANRPGTSKHELGLAADVWLKDGSPASSSTRIRRSLNRLGYTFPYAHEPWHTERSG